MIASEIAPGDSINSDGMEVFDSAESQSTVPSSSSFLVRNRYLISVLALIVLVGTIHLAPSSDNQIINTKTQQPNLTFDVNGPPPPGNRYGSTMSRTTQATVQIKPRNVEDLPFPVVVTVDDPDVSHASTKAADALECRASVIAFVINATDAKDECDGLKKAFDKTCNSDSTQEIIDKSNEKVAKKNAAAAAAAAAAASGPQRRRKLFKDQPDTSLRWRVLAHQTYRWLARRVSSWQQKDFFYAEESVFSEWDDANYQVKQGIDRIVHKQTIHRILEKSSLETTQEVIEEPVAVVVKPDKPKQSLTLPTSQEHVSGKMLSETLLLQNEDAIQSAIRTAANHTNVTLNEAAVDAVISAKAVQDTTAVVSAVLNDPTSVEARTCCTSILNVFHENCDQKEEETVSDKKLFLIVFVIAFCGLVKSMIRHFRIRWLPEAAGCILVGGTLLHFLCLYCLQLELMTCLLNSIMCNSLSFMWCGHVLCPRL